MDVHLVFLADVKYGGFVTYTVHLARALQTAGHRPAVWKLARQTEARPRPFAAEIAYRNIGLGAAEQGLCGHGAVLLTAVQPARYAEAAGRLVAAGAAVTLHDPNDFKDAAWRTTLRRLRARVVAIRPAVAAHLTAQGVDVTYIPHPYVPQAARWGLGGARYHAISLSRLDWDKHTELIAAANLQLPPECQVAVFGAENRRYTHLRLDPHWPAWRVAYHGAFPAEPDAGAHLARRAAYVVDMSAIAGDGGGTQYTFLEAWDAGARLIVNRAWLTGRADDVLQPGVNCLVAGTAAELAALLAGDPAAHDAVCAGGRAQLARHAPAAVVPRYESLWADRAA